jgi:hypothetical protein
MLSDAIHGRTQAARAQKQWSARILFDRHAFDQVSIDDVMLAG